MHRGTWKSQGFSKALRVRLARAAVETTAELPVWISSDEQLAQSPERNRCCAEAGTNHNEAGV